MLVARGTGPPIKRSLRREIPTRSLCCYLGQLGHSAVFLSFGGYGARVQLEKEERRCRTRSTGSVLASARGRNWPYATKMCAARLPARLAHRSEEHTSELQSLMRISYAVFCLKKKKNTELSTHTRCQPRRNRLYADTTDTL